MAHRLNVGGEVVLYGDVGDMWGDGTGFTDRDVIDALADIGPGDVTVRLNSGGGYVKDGVAIYNALRGHPGKVTISVDGIAASSASVIAMAGNSIVMRTGALMMIHDPSGFTFGNAEAHRGTADVLDKMADVIAGVYALRTGEPVAAMRDLMKTETWLDADEAVEFGFATDKDEAAADAVAAFDYGIYVGAPASIPQDARRALPASPVADATSRKEPIMAKQETVTATETKAELVVNHAGEIFARCEAAKLTMAETATVMKAAAGDLEKGKDAIINALAARDTQTEIRPVATVTADARDRFREGVSKALMVKAGLEGGEVNEFSSMTLREIAREALARNNVKMSFSDPMAMVGAAFTMQHSTSDFVEVLANIANKSMLKGYLEAEETFEQWTARGTLADFKATKRIDLNLFPALSEVLEGAEYTYGTIGDRAESIQLATYGKMFPITRQAIINDDMSVFTRVPSRMGRAARRTIGNPPVRLDPWQNIVNVHWPDSGGPTYVAFALRLELVQVSTGGPTSASSGPFLADPEGFDSIYLTETRYRYYSGSVVFPGTPPSATSVYSDGSWGGSLFSLVVNGLPDLEDGTSGHQSYGLFEASAMISPAPIIPTIGRWADPVGAELEIPVPGDAGTFFKTGMPAGEAFGPSFGAPTGYELEEGSGLYTNLAQQQAATSLSQFAILSGVTVTYNGETYAPFAARAVPFTAGAAVGVVLRGPADTALAGSAHQMWVLCERVTA